MVRGRIEVGLDRLLAYHRVDPDNERLAAHLFKHRTHLFTFLQRSQRFTAFAQRLLCLPLSAVPLLLAPASLPP